MDIDEFAYELPDDRIAQQPATPREAARLLVDDPTATIAQHRYVAELPELLQPDDVVVVNNTRVIPARLHVRRASGAAVEVLLLEPRSEGSRCWEALLRPSRRLRVGERLVADPTTRPDARAVAEGAARDELPLEVELVASLGEGRWELRFGGSVPVERLLDVHGEVPLPPYITAPLADPSRYQTVFAEHPGSVAAPTAGLHLSQVVLDGLAARGVRVVPVELAVGLGTFRPITVARVEDHVMHHERYRVPAATAAALADARTVVAIGTTVVRTLETWAATGVAEGYSDLFIRRPYPFAVVDRLLTNFHVPRSSLLVMIDAFVGPRWRELYRQALEGDYRFLSFGDAMLLTRR